MTRKITDLIGNTPLLEVVTEPTKILLKVERFNPGGSVKDRAAVAMIEDAEARGILHEGGVIIEPTSGNTGIGLAWVGREKGYRVILTMPDSMSQERRSLLKAYGAELELTPGGDGMKGSIKRAHELAEAIAGSVILDQFSNPANPAVHELTTGEEIWRDTEGQVDIFVAGVGTGGTITGVGRALKHHNRSVEIVAVEPAESAVLSGGEAGPHKIQGIGAGFKPDNYDSSIVDCVVTVRSDDAIAATTELAHKHGLLVGISSGAAFAAAKKLAEKEVNRGKTIVALLPDSGERYLSLGIF